MFYALPRHAQYYMIRAMAYNGKIRQKSDMAKDPYYHWNTERPFRMAVKAAKTHTQPF